MQKPTKAHFNHKRGTSMLYFPDNTLGEYYMRGGICWPTSYEIDGVRDVNGCAVMVGQEVETKICYIFDVQTWIVVDSILDSNQKVEFTGIGLWFNRLWSRFFARDFYWKQDFELAKKYRLEILRSKMVKPKPQFIEVPWTDDEDALNVVWKQAKMKKLLGDKGSILSEQMALVKKGDKQVYPAVHALCCAMMGIERFPWRKR